MKTRFYLRKGTKSYSINFEYRNSYGNIRLRTSTGFTILNPKEWDAKKERLKLPSSVLNAANINLNLSAAIFKFNKSIMYINEDELSEIHAQKIMYVAFGKSNNIYTEKTNFTKRNLIEYYEWFLDYYSMNNSPYTNKNLTLGTIKTYRTGLSRLQEYIEDRKLKSFSFNDCNRDFYNDYISYLTAKNYSKNYIGTIIQKLKTVLGYAFDEGIHSNVEFKKNYFSKFAEEIDHVYLSTEELKRIMDLDLQNSVLEIVRDIFLIGCNTGLRISDILSLLKKTNQIIFTEADVKYFKIKQIKTSSTVIIPLNSVVNDIINKYKGSLPKYQHLKVINENIKKICKRANITENHIIRRTEGGKEVEYEFPKYKLVSSHTARRSFCTNAYKSGMPIQDIMAISGHKTERVFLNYVKVEKVENAKRIAKYSFFH
ncbi:tyrosine-type recombinase/integrase [Flavobacterium phycosphaerae]|uniref:tyrosine-type recombinase/integrase n=1 Tax=Flavobacterium phycosphaerae TaxID=2697515 RepID=UPI001389D841|nr:site-specific integrase [Flavobacterium phycosphaerae]